MRKASTLTVVVDASSTAVNNELKGFNIGGLMQKIALQLAENYRKNDNGTVRTVRSLLEKVPERYENKVKTWVDESGLDLIHHCIINDRPDVLQFVLEKTSLFPAWHIPVGNPYAHLAAYFGLVTSLRTILKHRPGDYFKASLPTHELNVTRGISKALEDITRGKGYSRDNKEFKRVKQLLRDIVTFCREEAAEKLLIDEEFGEALTISNIDLTCVSGKFVGKVSVGEERNKSNGDNLSTSISLPQESNIHIERSYISHARSDTSRMYASNLPTKTATTRFPEIELVSKSSLLKPRSSLQYNGDESKYQRRVGTTRKATLLTGKGKMLDKTSNTDKKSKHNTERINTKAIVLDLPDRSSVSMDMPSLAVTSVLSEGQFKHIDHQRQPPRDKKQVHCIKFYDDSKLPEELNHGVLKGAGKPLKITQELKNPPKAMKVRTSSTLLGGCNDTQRRSSRGLSLSTNNCNNNARGSGRCSEYEPENGMDHTDNNMICTEDQQCEDNPLTVKPESLKVPRELIIEATVYTPWQLTPMAIKDDGNEVRHIIPDEIDNPPYHCNKNAREREPPVCDEGDHDLESGTNDVISENMRGVTKEPGWSLNVSKETEVVLQEPLSAVSAEPSSQHTSPKNFAYKVFGMTSNNGDDISKTNITRVGDEADDDMEWGAGQLFTEYLKRATNGVGTLLKINQKLLKPDTKEPSLGPTPAIIQEDVEQTLLDISSFGMNNAANDCNNNNEGDSDVERRDSRIQSIGHTPLSLAAHQGHCECIQVILDYIVDRDSLIGNTTLSQATEAKSALSILILLNRQINEIEYQKAVLIAMKCQTTLGLTALIKETGVGMSQITAIRRNLFNGNNLFHVMFCQSLLRDDGWAGLVDMTKTLIDCDESVNGTRFIPGTYPLYSLVHCAFNHTPIHDETSVYLKCFNMLVKAGADPYLNENRKPGMLIGSNYGVLKQGVKTDTEMTREKFSSAIECVVCSAKWSVHLIENMGWVKTLMEAFLNILMTFAQRVQGECTDIFKAYMSVAPTFGLNEGIVENLLRKGLDPGKTLDDKSSYALNIYFVQLLSHLRQHNVPDCFDVYKTEIDTIVMISRRMPIDKLKKSFLSFFDTQVARTPLQAIPIVRYFNHLIGQLLTKPRRLTELCALSVWNFRCDRKERLLKRLTITHRFTPYMTALVLPRLKAD